MGRSWFNPREGLTGMVWPLDYILAGFFGLVSFILLYVNYWLPPTQYFDEIYFARAAEEYLHHEYIYESTHPPLTKLIITLSTLLFGGLQHGNPHGWRFANVLFGAVVVVLLYVFAKRLLRSTVFASLAAVFFTADGMHFVQSRIATPEGMVVVFSLGTIYAFYRFWIASQSTVREYEPETLRRAMISAAAALAAGYAVSAIVTIPFHQSKAAFVVAGLYFAAGLYLMFRLVLIRRLFNSAGTFVTYAEGTFLIGRGAAAKRALSPTKQGEARITYAPDGSVGYATPEGSATYSPGLVRDDEGNSQEGRHATAWLVTFTVLLGALVSSKWYGVMVYGVAVIIVVAVWMQRYWLPSEPKRWGNPFGFRLDVTLVAILFLSMTVYLLVWVPEFIRQIEIKNLSDLIYRQYTMFMYHSTLKATHLYSSPWWTWPLDKRPVSYYWLGPEKAHAPCCVEEILSLPNPLILWFGLFSVPVTAFLAWRERSKGYTLLIVAYLLQWLPWARSPRIAFIYHFYVDIPLVILCNTIVLQRLWQLGQNNKLLRTFSRIGVVAYAGAVVVAFMWFYPILAGVPIPYADWHARMWFSSWV